MTERAATPASDEAAAPAATRWLTVALLLGAGIAAAFQVGKAPVALPALRQDLGAGLVAAGWIISTFNLLGAAAGALIGAAGDRIGHRRAVIGGLGLTALASLAGAAAPGTGFLLATRFVEGLGFIATVTAAPALIVRATRPADLRLAFGYWSCYMPVGTALMMLASPPILAGFGWRGLWLANAGLLLAAAAAIALATRRLASASRRGRGLAVILGDMLATLRRPGPVVLALAFGSYAFQYLGVLGFLPTLLIQASGMAPATAALLTALAIAGNAAGVVAGGGLLHRDVPRWILVAAPSLAMGLMSVVIYADALPLALRYAAVLAFSIIGGMLPAALLAGAPVHAPTPLLVGTTTGLITQGSNLGQSIGPPALAALAAAMGGWTWSPALLLPSAGIGVALALVLRRLERRR